MRTRSKFIVGVSAGLLATCAFGAAANAAPVPAGYSMGVTVQQLSAAQQSAAQGTITPTSGPVAGGTQTTLSLPTLSNTTIATSGGNVALGADGNIYTQGGLKLVPPAGVTFTSVSAQKTAGNQNHIGAIGSDGNFYSAFGPFTDGQQLPKISLPTTITATDGGNVALGADGNIYSAGGLKLVPPAGVTFTSVSSQQNPSGQAHTGAVGSDGNFYSAVGGFTNGQQLPKISLPTTITATSGGNTALGADGNIYTAGGLKIVPPAGVTFTSISAQLTAGWENHMGAIGSDGNFYSAFGGFTNGQQLPKISLPTTITATDGGNFALGADGNIYSAGGLKLVPPAGVTFTSVSSQQDYLGKHHTGAIGSDGNFYSGYDTSTLAKVPTGVAPTVTGVTFGGVASTGVSQPTGTTVAATTPAHAAGPVDVVVTLNNGKTYTLPQSFTYEDVTVATPVTIISPTAGADYANKGKDPFTGTGAPGATITVKDTNGNPVCTTTVAGDGTWSCQPDAGALAPNPNAIITVEQKDNGTISAASVALNVGDPLVGPIVEPGGLLLVGLLAAAGLGTAGAVKIRSRRITTQATTPQA